MMVEGEWGENEREREKVVEYHNGLGTSEAGG